jgi:hypothetical protein
VEAQVLELFADLGGDEALRKVVAYQREQERLSRLGRSGETSANALGARFPRSDAVTPGGTQAPSSSPPATP